MREILFRGKMKKAGVWVYGAFCRSDCDTPTGPSVNRANIIMYDEPFDGYWVEVDPETVGQYTGLTDKNGKKIFEGDIVKADKFNTPNKLYVIKYDLLLGAFIGEDNGTMYFTTFDGDSELFEIIGNIHDNQELIGGKEDGN